MTGQVIPIDPAKVKIADRLRDVDKGEVDKLAASMNEVGQITPIEVREQPDADGFYTLIAGAHRVAAAIQNGDETIFATLYSGDADTERLREIDENLYRHELTAYDLANSLEERRQIWERINGKSRRGGDRRSKRQVGAFEKREALTGFYAEVGNLFSLPKRTVQRALERKRCIIPEIWTLLRGTAEAKNGALLDKIAGLDNEGQKRVLDHAKASSNSFAYSILYTKPATQRRAPTVVLIMKKVGVAWEQWDPSERAVFLREIKKLGGGK